MQPSRSHLAAMQYKARSPKKYWRSSIHREWRGNGNGEAGLTGGGCQWGQHFNFRSRLTACWCVQIEESTWLCKIMISDSCSVINICWKGPKLEPNPSPSDRGNYLWMTIVVWGILGRSPPFLLSLALAALCGGFCIGPPNKSHKIPRRITRRQIVWQFFLHFQFIHYSLECCSNCYK